jgi:hypothetical protein
MVVKIITKVLLPFGSDPAALKAIGLCKAHRIIFPLSKADDAENDALVVKLGQAIKREKTLFAKCDAAFTCGPEKFKKAAKTYLSDMRCLLVALFNDNKQRPLEDRRSLEELVALAKKYSILKCLSEPARVWQEPKKPGKGMRVICSFGPVARAAQQMFKKLLRLTYEPQDFQFAQLTFAEKVQSAMTAIKEKGHNHVTEIDIKDFFPSFTEEALIKSLPLPPEATRQILLAKSASWGPHPLYAKHDYISSPPGIPQGSASSAAVADWCIANMPLEKLTGSVVVNHADNFFGLSASSDDAVDVTKALSSGIAGLPGGDFLGKTEQAVEVKDGFRMLGCWVFLSKTGELVAEPTEANYNELRKRAGRQRQRVYRRLKAAAGSQSKQLRIKGLQDFLRFESMARGWVQAFAFCGPHVNAVKDHYDYDLNQLRQTFEITDAELKPLKDASTTVTFKWYSGK